jgi:peptide/nickel transport system substrate-binding protein
MGNYNNPDVDRLIDDALMLDPTDPNRNLKALEAEKLVMAEHMYIPWVAEGPMMHAMPWVLNFAKNYDWQIIDPWNLDLDLTKRP